MPLSETLKKFDETPSAKSISAYLTDVEYKLVKSFISSEIKTALEVCARRYNIIGSIDEFDTEWRRTESS